MRYSFLEEAWNDTSIDEFNAPVVSTANVQNLDTTKITDITSQEKVSAEPEQKVTDVESNQHSTFHQLNRQELFNTVIYIVGGIFLIQVLDIFVRLGKKSS